MSQDPDLADTDPSSTHPQEVKAVAVDLGRFVCTYTSPRSSTLSGAETGKVDLLDTATRPERGRRYRLLLIIEQDGP